MTRTRSHGGGRAGLRGTVTGNIFTGTVSSADLTGRFRDSRPWRRTVTYRFGYLLEHRIRGHFRWAVHRGIQFSRHVLRGRLQSELSVTATVRLGRSIHDRSWLELGLLGRCGSPARYTLCALVACGEAGRRHPPPDFSYNGSHPFPAVVGETIALTPAVSGSIERYGVSPELPSGLTLDGLTGVISGTPTQAQWSCDLRSPPAAAGVVAAYSLGAERDRAAEPSFIPQPGERYCGSGRSRP